MSGLAGRHAVITGGAGDIGAAIAAELGRRGAAVTVFDVKPPAEARRRLDTLDVEVTYRQVDVTDRAAVDEGLARLAPVDIAVANAGIVEPAPFLEISQDQWHRHLAVNLTGCFNVAQAAARQMAERGTGGRILFTGSWVGEVPWPDIAAYSVTKAGLAMLARSMAKELARHGILVNTLAPGIVAAGLAKQQAETDPHYAALAAAAVPLGRLQTPEQVARVAAFLCSPDADYITGTTILADGGCSLFNQPTH